MATVLDSLLVALGFDFDDADLKEFEAATEKAVDTIDNLTLAAAGLIATFVGVSVVSAQSTDDLTKQARTIGVLTEELDALNFAAEQTTGTSAGVSEGLRQLTLRASEAARGLGAGVEAFGILGVEVTDSQGRVKDINTLLGESADALNNIGDRALRLELAEKLGLSQLDLLLQQGSQGIAELTAEARRLGVVTDEDSKAAEEFNDQWNRLLRIANNIVRVIATKMLPLFTSLLMRFQEWFLVNQDLIESNLISFLNAIVVVMENLQAVIIAILSLKFVLWITRLTIAFKTLGAAALIAQVKMFAIVIAIAAVVAAIGILIQDFIVFQRGGDSAIGRLIDRFPVLKSVIEGISDALTLARNSLSDLLTTLDNSGAFKLLDRLSTLANPANLVLASVDLAKGLTSSGTGAGGAPTTNNSNATNISRLDININGGDTDTVRSTVLDVLNGEIQTASNNAQSTVAN